MTPAQVGAELERLGLGLHIPNITALSEADGNGTGEDEKYKLKAEMERLQLYLDALLSVEPDWQDDEEIDHVLNAIENLREEQK